MEDESMGTRVEETAAHTAYYLQLQLDRLKLRLLDNFSNLFNTVFGVLLVVILASFAGLFLAVALVWAIGLWIGSMLWALLIMAGVFAIAAVVVYYKRKNLIIDPVIQMLSKLMFEKETDTDDHE